MKAYKNICDKNKFTVSWFVGKVKFRYDHIFKNPFAIISFLFALVVAPSNTSFADDIGLTDEQLKIFDMDLKQLLRQEVVVTSAGKKPQKIEDTASAIYVVTQEDIRRSGAVNIMEALRIVPGVLVSKINQNRYAISIRGFNRRFGSDKLLVLIDGRSIYAPDDSGVFWLGQDAVLEDIDRIEVIRGPGATLWGSNAVAGVINIITKTAGKTQGILVAGGAGTEENGFGTFRYGGQIDEDFLYRVYGKYRERDQGVTADGEDSFDGKKIGQAGFRSDWDINSKNNLTIQADAFTVDAEIDIQSRFTSFSADNTPFRGMTTQSGANFLSRWTHELDNESSLKLQAYYNFFERESDLPFENISHQADLDFQHDFKLGERHSVAWGLNYRFTQFDIQKNIIFNIPSVSTNLFGSFINDEITLIPNELNLIVGSKFEHNEFSGFEIQPSVRAIWKPKENHTIWAAFSRAVRIPSLRESLGESNRATLTNFEVLPNPPFDPSTVLVKEINTEKADSEKLLSYEAGYRYNPNPNFSLDITGYFFDYKDLIEFELGDGVFEPFPVQFNIPISNNNVFDGQIYGIELSMDWNPFKNWKVGGSYTFTKINLTKKDGFNFNESNDGFNADDDFNAQGEPNHLVNVHSYITLPYSLEFDQLFYYTSTNSARDVPGFTRVDLRLGWKPTDYFKLSLVGQNVFDSSHPELNELFEFSSETQRSFYAKATFEF
ncbi:MAG: TonB-dependent receptor plug domain-containing protein [Nitrospinales bacterium]